MNYKSKWEYLKKTLEYELEKIKNFKSPYDFDTGEYQGRENKIKEVLRLMEKTENED